MRKPQVEVSLQLSFGGKAPGLDLRSVRLLELIDAHGSMTHAASALGISYRTAWILVDKLQQCGHGPLVSATRGGNINGSRLTPAGHALVDQFRRVERELATFLDRFNASAGATNPQ